MVSQLRPGQLVASRAGRDRGRFFVVVEVVDERYYRIADGKLRSIKTPKLKNRKHLQPHNRILESIAMKLERGKALSDEELRAAIREEVELKGG